jgi:epoxyqueuosine reductase
MSAPQEPLALTSGAAWHPPPSAPGSVPPEAHALGNAIRDAALTLGFARVGFCPIEPFEAAGKALDDWLDKGMHGEMAYLAGESRSEPRQLLPAARSLIVVAMPYGRDAAPSQSGEQLVVLTGRVARYARGADYHAVLRDRLHLLADRCAALTGRGVLARPCVDTAPLLEREAARRAGIGFTAKSTLTIAPGIGSYVLLGELLTDIELQPDRPLAQQGCGSCTTCLVACPTSAFVDAYTLDARRCISYLTIELRGSIPRELRPLIGRWVFGCDVCQEVCPFNQSRRPRPQDAELAPRAHLTDPELLDLLQLTASGYRRFVRRSALRRIDRARLQRNAAVALGNCGRPEATSALAQSLTENPSALVREHVAWALGRLPGEAAREALRGHRSMERDATVIAEIDYALGQ